jgi:hypothetical protein
MDMKMTIVLAVLLALFGIGAGFFIGCGNFRGFLGAITPGLIAGIVLAGPMIRERQWTAAAVIACCTLVGSIISSQVSDTNALKRYARTQSGLHIKAGSFELGRSPE